MRWRRCEPLQHLGKVLLEAVGDLAGLVGSGAVALEVVRHDADGGKGDLGTPDVDAHGPARLLAVHAEAG